MSKYDHKKIEKTWKEKWEKEKLYKVADKSDKPKFYVLDMFPYPSGAGLHVGHPKGYIATDVIARMKMMQGFNVLHPMGWDAFGLPAENYAIQNKVHPKVATDKNVETFKKQLGLLGFTYDWDREVNTTDPKYYKWTQWTFLQMFKRGLAFESWEPVNWCPKDQTVLANEDLEDGKCERCGTPVERKPMRQWVLKITDYAERLLQDIDTLDKWPEPIKEMQRNWIGKSEGAEVEFKIQNSELKIKVFTTRPDTLFGATYCVLAPEHTLISNLKFKISNFEEVEKYVEQAKHKSDLERTELQKDKSGVELKGVKAINPVNNEELPIFVADYVLMGYGTGAIMAVPAHDERDFEFAKKYNLPIKEVVIEKIGERVAGTEIRRTVRAICERNGKFLVNHEKKMNEYVLVGGGAKEGEILEEALKREIREETGYVNIEVGKFLGVAEHNFFHKTFGENKRFVEHIFVVKILNDESIPLSEHELVKSDPQWLSAEEMLEEFKKSPSFERHREFLNWYINGRSECFSGNGVAVNSEFLNDLETPEAKQKMIACLEEKGIGKRKVQYKLRDWVFSRQRYWGEPIPLIKCENCANKKYKYVLIHAFGNISQDAFYPWLKEKLEAEGHQVLVLDLPNTERPKAEEQAEFILSKTKLDGDTVIITHSHGGAVGFRILESASVIIRKLILVDSFIRPEFSDKKRPDVEASTDYKFNFEKIKKHCKEFVVVADNSFAIIPELQSKEMAELFGANLVLVKPNDTHFRSKIEPAVLEAVKIDGWIPVPESELPLELPKVEHYEPTGTGESPLANIDKWVNTKCPVCGGKAKRETNTMPQWAGSCWYYLRYCDPKNHKELINKEIEKYWNPVDLYVGGAEHATRHLIYARFWHKFLYDIGVVNNSEPFTKLQNVGLILAEDGRKMSKRWGNVINPDDVVGEYGADAMRLYEMFMGPFDQACAWSTNGVVGMRRFLEKVWNLQEKINDKNVSSSFTTLLHQTIKKVSEDIETMRYNTAISQMMILVNEISKADSFSVADFSLLLRLLAPFAPHLTEELWSELGNKESIFKSEWPKFDPNLIKDETITIAVQVNGKLRDTLEVAAEISEEEIKKLALASEKVQKWLEGKEPKKVIYVKDKLVSVVF